MTRRTLIVTSAIFLLLTTLGANLAQAQQYAIRYIDVPGAAATIISDTNKAGEIVGCYAVTGLNNGGPGLVLANATFKLVKYPKAPSTCAEGVSNDGKIAGTYTDINGNTHGFLLVGKNVYQSRLSRRCLY